MINPFKSCDCAKTKREQVYRLGDLINLPDVHSFVFNEISTDKMIMYVGVYDGIPMGKRAPSNELIKLDVDMMVKDVF